MSIWTAKDDADVLNYYKQKKQQLLKRLNNENPSI